MAANRVAPKEQLASLAAANALIAEVKAMDTKTLAGGAAVAAKKPKVGASSPSLGHDVSWYPSVPLGHTAYSWGGDEDDADVKLSNVWGHKAEQHYVGKGHHDEKHGKAEEKAAAAPAAAAPAPAAAAAPAEDKKKGGDKKGADKKGADKKGGDKKADNKKEGEKSKDDKKAAKGKPAARPEVPPPTAAAGTVPVFARLDIRAGKIVKAWKHPKADKLYIEHIDVGEKEPRTIVSGLVEHVPLNEFEGASVLVVCNLKPADMRGQISSGMVLAASNDKRKTVELVSPAAGTKPGERVFLQGEPSTKDSKVDAEVDLFTPGNAWVDAKDFLTTDANCHALYNGKAIVTSAGPARCKSKSNGQIS